MPAPVISPLALQGVRGDRNNRGLLMMGQVMDKLAGADAVHIRHLNIHQDQIHLQLLGLLSTACWPLSQRITCCTRSLQQGANQLQVSRVVVDGHYRHWQLAICRSAIQRRGGKRVGW